MKKRWAEKKKNAS